MKHKTLIENTFPFPLLSRYETSKLFPKAIATILLQEGVLTFVNAGNAEKWASENPFWLENLQKTTPKWPPKHV